MTSSPLLQRYNALPRALKWGLWAVVLLVMYLAVVDPYLVDTAARLHARATDTSTKLVALNKQAASAGWQDTVNAVARLGPAAMINIDAPQTPGAEPVSTRLAFDNRVRSIMSAHKIADYAAGSRPVAMGDGPLKRAINPQTEQIDRSQAEIKFTANPETFSKVLADLEMAPEVTAISEVEVRKDRDTASRLLNITIRAETWGIVKKAGRAR